MLIKKKNVVYFTSIFSLLVIFLGIFHRQLGITQIGEIIFNLSLSIFFYLVFNAISNRISLHIEPKTLYRTDEKSKEQFIEDNNMRAKPKIIWKYKKIFIIQLYLGVLFIFLVGIPLTYIFTVIHEFSHAITGLFSGVQIEKIDTWYRLNNDDIKYFFSGVSGDIDSLAWNSVSEGYVNITFYANDSFNRVNSVQVTVIKDLSFPIITVYSPINAEIFYDDSPNYNVTVFDYSPYQKWYEIEGISIKFYFSASIGKINEDAWEYLPLGNTSILFFAEDSLGKISNCSIMLIKEADSEPNPEPNPTSIPGPNLLALVGIICASFIVIIKKMKKNSVSKQ